MDEAQKKQHQIFAVDSNNLAWELATRDRSPEEDHEMLDAAHASAWHWSVVGTDIHFNRASMLLGHVHSLLDMGSTALVYAQECGEYFLTKEDTPDWEVAFVHMIIAQAAYAVGDMEAFPEAYELTQEAIDAIKSEEDRNVVLASFVRIPKP